tara:strand:- start:95 stop:4819 length:4725 start_codon:yes stop_codon:yes gene_type:complete
MLGKKLINPGAVACTTDTAQILDGDTTQSTALYRFEDNANDTASGTGKFGKGARFTSALTTRVDLSSNAAFAKSNDFSLSMWFYIDTMASGDNQTILAYNTSLTPRYFIMFNNGNIGNIRFYGGGSTNRYSANNLFSAGSWYHLAVSKSSTAGLVVYLNGTAVITQTGETAAYTNGSQANSKNCIGAYYAANSHLYQFKGKIDQFRVFNKPITQAEVNTLYTETSSTVNTLQILGDTSCIATYTFEGNADDLSNNYDGTATSDVTYDYSGTASNVTYVAGKFDKAAVFNGSSSKIVLPNSSLGITDASNFSFSCWFNTNSSTQDNQGILWANGSNTGVRFGVGINSTSQGGDTSVYFGVGTSSFTYINSGTSAFTANTWVHVVGVKSSTTGMSLYVNNVLKATNTGATGAASTTSTGDNRIGGYKTTAESSWFNGKIDQVRIFDKALSPGEVNSLYNETTTTVALTTISNPSTIAYYKMADASDETGSYNGTASTVNFNVQGKYGFAAEFNGSSSYMSFPAPYSHTSNEDNITVSWWMNGDTAFSNGSFWGILGGEIANSSGNAGTININAYGKGTNQVYISLTRIWGNSARYHASSSTSSSDWVTMIPGQWYHNVLTYDPATNSSKYYVDGTLIYNITFTTYTTSGNYTNSTLAWGKYRNGAHYFNGKIDQARFFNKVISADEVTKLYNEIQCADTITTPEDYFNTVLYTGNATARSIGVGFQPDFTWIKDRTTNYSHVLLDSVRGVNSELNSNDDSAVYTETNGLTAFTSTGFNLGNLEYSYNKNNDNYVSWNWKASSLINKSASFNGSSSVITINSSFDFSSSFSISMWFNADALPSSTYVPLFFTDGYGGSNSDYGVALYLYGNTIKPWIDRQATYTNIFTAGTLYTGTWYHVVLNRDYNSKWELFLNGSSLGTYTSAGLTDNYTPSSFSTIGKHANSAMWFDGRIDQTRIFNKALSSSEVTTLYNETSSTINTLQVLSDTSCIAAYPLGIDANDLDTSTPQNGTASNVVFDNPGHLTRNNNGTIESTVSASPESGFSIVTYSPNNTVGMSIGHGLSQAPSLVITKRLDTSQDWGVYTNVSTGNTTTNWLSLNDTDAYGSGNFMTLKSTTLELPATGAFWGNGGNQVAYCFANVDGYQHIGSYVGTAGTGPFVYTGFEPAWLMIKEVSNTGNWCIYDNKRDTVNPNNVVLAANSSNAESSYSSGYNVNFHTNGFEIAENTSNDLNTSGSTYIFMAIAANPDTTAPTEANSFKTALYTGNNGTKSITGVGFKPDFTWIKARTDTRSHTLIDSVRGATRIIQSESTAAEWDGSSYIASLDSDGFTVKSNAAFINSSSQNYVSWNWKGLDHDRNLAAINTDGSIPSIVSANPAAGFSIVSLDKPNTNTDTYGHGLSSVPEMIILKRTASSDDWHVYHKDLGNTVRISLNSSAAKVTGTGVWGSTTPTASLFTLQNQTGGAHIAYCFHSVAGYSKIGIYQGNSSTTGPLVSVGFEPSFIMVKGTTSGYASHWVIIDSIRDTDTVKDKRVLANLTNAESDDANWAVEFNSDGFQPKSTFSGFNHSSGTYLYMAFK